MTDDQLRAHITALREERGLSKARLAREAGISDAYLVQIEQGSRTPSDDVLRKLSAALGLHPLQLAADDGRFPVSGHMEAVFRHYAEAVRSGDHARIADAARALDADLQWEGLTADGKPTEDNFWEGLEEHIPPPEGWTQLTSQDRALVQRLIRRILTSGDYE